MLKKKNHTQHKNHRIKLKGIPASPGVAIGKAFLLDSEDLTVPKKHIPAASVHDEIARFEDSLIQTRKEILQIQDKISAQMGRKHAEIFSAHLLVLEDRMLIEEVITRLEKEKLNVEAIFLDVLKNYAKAFSKIQDEYLKERIADIEDVGKRILRNLIGKRQDALLDLKEKVIVVAYDLSPSDTASMHKKAVLGFITDIGGRTSHTAIMAKSLEIPAVVGLQTVTKKVKSGDTLIIDGTHGVVIVNPDKAVLEKYQQQKRKIEQAEEGLLKITSLPSETTDKKKVKLTANIELPDEIPSVLAHGAEGIGLYRTEYLYLDRRDFPTEEEQYKAYSKVAKQMLPHSVIIRTMDLGGDKFISQLDIPYEMNPFMGWRAIRFSIAKPQIFKEQLRAILRASVHGKLKIMYPMISGIEELRQVNGLFSEVKAELKKKKVKFDEKIQVGAMIEIPSAALTSDLLAEEVNFFSIGTNDLIQYALAVDRVNEKIAYLYEPTHPAVLRLIKHIIDSGHKNKIEVGMCGEMAGEPHLVLVLLGLGLDEFSMSPVMLPEVKKVIRSISFTEAQKIARKALEFGTAKEIKDYTKEQLKKLIPEIMVLEE